ncbi:MAG: tripartite tricarboxylate transporter TctB family protein [Burkholderiaceae bacterium]
MTPARESRRGARLMALALVAVVLVAAWQAWLIPQPPALAEVGPREMPIALVAALAIAVLVYLRQAWRGEAPDTLHQPDEAPLPGGRGRVVWIVAGLAAILLLTPVLGIGAAAVAAFVLVARAFDSRRWLRDLIVALIFVFAVWYVFDRLLGVQLGPFVTLGFPK